MKTFDSLQLTRSIHCGAIRTFFPVLNLAKEFNRPDLAIGDADVTRFLGHTHGAFHAFGLGPGDVAGAAPDFGAVKAVDHDLVVGAAPSKNNCIKNLL
jgi:hypothetical protein